MRLLTPRKRTAQQTEHITLMGDSVFDCDHYTKPHPGVAARLREALPGHRIANIARDGATTYSLPLQLPKIPEDATRIIMSIGGNNALSNSDILHLNHKRRPDYTKGLPFVQAALNVLDDRLFEFELEYREVMGKVISTGLPVTICTIYNPDYGDDPEAYAVRTALRGFNDVITSYARQKGLPVIDLRDVVNVTTDFEMMIEPSGQGARKIAAAIAGTVTGGVVAA